MQKTIMVHIDGIPSHTFEELGAQGLLHSAQTPHLDHLAQHGEYGRLGIPGESRSFTGEMAFLALLGYEPKKWYSGSGTFEALNLEVVLERNDVAFLCHLVTLRGQDGWGEGKKLGPHLILDDPNGGGIETEEARELLDTIKEQLVSENIQFYMGRKHRHLMVWAGGQGKVVCHNPQEACGQTIDSFLPTGEGSQLLRELMEAARVILQHHPVNQDRLNEGLKPVNCLWPWGLGQPVELSPLRERWTLTGTVVSPDGPYVGIGLASGLQVFRLEDVGNGEAAWLQELASLGLRIIEKQDLTCLHVPFSTWLLNDGQCTPSSRLVEFLQNIDEHLIGVLRQSSDSGGLFRIVVVCTPSATKNEGAVTAMAPYSIYEGQEAMKGDPSVTFDERAVAGLPLRNATKLLDRFFVKR